MLENEYQFSPNDSVILPIMKLFYILLFFFTSFFSLANEKEGPLKGLLVTGGGHHDYATQKNIIT
ncbi:MAG: hypothetical protein EBS13_05490, partial [Verrucomicrobia bacterium]|nr:hypothetical protein [Verrucomicrobiota bacterium]